MPYRTKALAELVEDAPCGIVATDPDGRILYINGTLARWLGIEAAPDGGPDRFPQLFTVPGRLFYETHIASMMRLQGHIREISCALEVRGGPPLPVLLSGVARYDGNGSPSRFDYTIFDARERQIYEEELRRARRQADELAAIVRSSPNAILRVDGSGLIQSWNRGAERIFSRAADTTLGCAISDCLPLMDSGDWFSAAVAQCETEPEAVLEQSDSHGREFETTVAPIDGEANDLSARFYSVILRDISERKRLERRLQVTLNEMRHRVNNSLAVVGGIARQSLPQEHCQTFTARLNALASANTALAQGGVGGADIRDLIAFTTEEAGGPDRLHASAASLLLSSRQANALSMALHELVTNAMKYGALSCPDGFVEVTCDRSPTGATGPIRFVWQERGGPPVARPTRVGFGTKMIQQVAKAELAADVTFEFDTAGVRCEIIFTPEAIDRSPGEPVA